LLDMNSLGPALFYMTLLSFLATGLCDSKGARSITCRVVQIGYPFEHNFFSCSLWAIRTCTLTFPRSATRTKVSTRSNCGSSQELRGVGIWHTDVLSGMYVCAPPVLIAKMGLFVAPRLDFNLGPTFALGNHTLSLGFCRSSTWDRF